MKKYLLLTVILLQTIFLFAQSNVVYNENGVSVSYSTQRYNTIELNGKFYDQYEVKFTFTNNSGNYIHNPQVCSIGFATGIQHPSSQSSIDFSGSGNKIGYVEYTDGTPLPENINNPYEEDKYGRAITRFIVRKGVTNECTKYILVKQGEEIGEPTYSVNFNHTYPIIVNGSDQLIETWINRQSNGISLNKASSWPLTLRTPYDGTYCGNSRPIGNKGDNIENKKISPQDLIKAIKDNSSEKLKIFKAYFSQEGYQFIKEDFCKSYFEEGNVNCLMFSNFSIQFTSNGMCSIVFGNNKNMMLTIKNNLKSVESTFVECESTDGDKSDYALAFSEGELEYFTK